MTTWRGDIDALAFRPGGGTACCMVHRRAFRALLGVDPHPEQCEAFFRANRAAFEAAARAKQARSKIADGANFHLTSRDVARQLGSSDDAGSVRI